MVRALFEYLVTRNTSAVLSLLCPHLTLSCFQGNGAFPASAQLDLASTLPRFQRTLLRDPPSPCTKTPHYSITRRLKTEPKTSDL